MADRINLEWANLRQLQGFHVLELHAVVIYVPIFRLGEPYPALARLSCEFPSVLESNTDSWTQRQEPARQYGQVA